jgi:hypothetical protein
MRFFYIFLFIYLLTGTNYQTYFGGRQYNTIIAVKIQCTQDEQTQRWCKDKSAIICTCTIVHVDLRINYILYFKLWKNQNLDYLNLYKVLLTKEFLKVWVLKQGMGSGCPLSRRLYIKLVAGGNKLNKH